MVAGILFCSNYHIFMPQVSPSDIGRIPHKIRSGFSSFTADQWKNWVMYFSLLSLHDILEGDPLECWRHFVLACRVLCA